MSFTAEIQNINDQTLKYAPSVLATVAAVESAAAGLPGQTKADIALNIVMAGAAGASNVPIPQVQSIASLISLFVGILNATGIFRHKTPPAPSA